MIQVIQSLVRVVETAVLVQHANLDDVVDDRSAQALKYTNTKLRLVTFGDRLVAKTGRM